MAEYIHSRKTPVGLKKQQQQQQQQHQQTTTHVLKTRGTSAITIDHQGKLKTSPGQSVIITVRRCKQHIAEQGADS